jgi:hypothetical protein
MVGAARRDRRGCALSLRGRVRRAGAAAWEAGRSRGGAEAAASSSGRGGREGEGEWFLPGGFDFVPCAVFRWCPVGPTRVLVGGEW